MFEATVADGVLQFGAPDTRWLSTGVAGGYRVADAAYNVSVPSGWDHEDLDAYVAERRAAAGFDAPGPTLFTGVDLEHARGARMDEVVVHATVGLSNPAALPVDGDAAGAEPPASGGHSCTEPPDGDGPSGAGTVNLLVGTTRPLTDGALATLVGTAVEARTATLLSLTGFTGTTTDAVVTGTPTAAESMASEGGAGERERWAGSGTAVGNAVRVCVRDAVRASFESRYDDTALPGSVDDADHGVVTGGSAAVFRP